MKRIKRAWFWLRERRNRLWVTPAIASVAAVLLALTSAWVSEVVPAGTFPDIERDTLDNLLTVVASSMLAVTTFSLSIMVSAFASAANNATPRATELVMGDEGTRSAIAMFLSAFIYAVVAQVALGMGYYDSGGRFVLFLGTVLVLVLLLVTLVQWVKTLSSLGRMSNTLGKIEGAASTALERHWRAPLLGGGPAPTGAAGERRGRPVYARRVTYVRHIDMAALQAYANAHAARVHVRVRPGALVHPGAELAWVEPDARADADPDPDADAAADAPAAGALHDDAGDEGGGSEGGGASLHKVLDAFYFGVERGFEQDPRFGLIVLSETAQRALSPAVNDPGTAIDVMNRMTRLLIESQQAKGVSPTAAEAPAEHARVTLVPLDEPGLVFDGFVPIARDGAATLEVMLRMQRLLSMVAASSRAGSVARAAREMAQRARDAGAHSLATQVERDALDAEHRRLFG